MAGAAVTLALVGCSGRRNPVSVRQISAPPPTQESASAPNPTALAEQQKSVEDLKKTVEDQKKTIEGLKESVESFKSVAAQLPSKAEVANIGAATAQIAANQQQDLAAHAQVQQVAAESNDRAKKAEKTANDIGAALKKNDEAAAASRPKPLGDYIPCFFDHDDDAFFRGQRFSTRQIGDTISRWVTLGIVPEGKQNTVRALFTGADKRDYQKLTGRAVQNGWILPASGQTPDEAAAELGGVLNAAVSALASGQSLDVGCSQSLMAWREVADDFGRRVADTYAAYQVVVRNLNQDKEFLLHDVQIAVDDLRFVGGRDRLYVRGVALEGQNYDKRNFAVRTLEALAGLASASSVGLTSRDFKNGVSIFTSGLIPGVKTLFPDRTIDQMNRLNDLAFSAHNSYKIVVGKSGSVTFVTFLPWEVLGETGKINKVDLKALENESFVVVSGIHIVEENKDQATVSELKCPQDGDHLDLSKGDSQDVTCPIKGNNLQKFSTLRLKNALESGDKQVADGTVSVSGQTSSGTVVFKGKDLIALNGTDYLAYIVGSNGQETATEIKVKVLPSISAITPAEIVVGGTSCRQGSTCAFTITGRNLGAIDRVELKAAAADASPAAVGTFDAASDAGSRKGHFAFADLNRIDAKKYLIIMVIQTQEVATTTNVTTKKQ